MRPPFISRRRREGVSSAFNRLNSSTDGRRHGLSAGKVGHPAETVSSRSGSSCDSPTMIKNSFGRISNGRTVPPRRVSPKFHPNGGEAPRLVLLEGISAPRDPQARAAFAKRISLLLSLPEVLQPKQHGQHSFELAVEMDLVTAEPFQLFRIERFAERLVPHERATGDFLSALIEPGEHLAFEKPAQTLDVRSGWFFILLEFIGLDLEPVRPPALRILAQLRQRSFVGVVCARSQHVERAPRHSLIVVKVSDLLFGVDGSDPDGFANV